MKSNTLPVADVEMVAAAKRLERAGRGYGADFLDLCGRAVGEIERTPFMYPVAEDAPPDRDVRYVYIARFHYRVIYAVLPDELLIVAFAHASRAPEYWHDRLPESP